MMNNTAVDEVYVINQSGGGGSSYEAGTGITIQNDTISVDTTVIAEKSDIPTLPEEKSLTSTNSTISITEGATTVSIDVANPLPSLLGTAGQVLSVNSGATGVEWATPPTVTLSTLNTAGITDIQQVAALPASPVATVLYLIPET